MGIICYGVNRDIFEGSSPLLKVVYVYLCPFLLVTFEEVYFTKIYLSMGQRPHSPLILARG